MMNVPILASNLGGISEIVRDGENGLLFEVGNVEMLTKIIRKVCDRGDLLDSLRQSSPGVYTLARNLDDFESLYGELAMAGTRERP
jgi:glycosyltransferase involved in cell wall biosynthesis